MRINLFRDESAGGVFAFPTDVSGTNIALVTECTEWIFLEAIDTLKFPEPWDIEDFRQVLNCLEADGYYLFAGGLLRRPE